MKTRLRFDLRRWNRRLDTTALVLSVLMIVVLSSAAADKAPDAEVGLCASKTSFFDHGVAIRNHQKWSKQDYKVFGFQTQPAPGRTDEVEVRFRLQFAVSNGLCSTCGTTDNAFRMEITPEGLRLVALHEPGVRDQEA